MEDFFFYSSTYGSASLILTTDKLRDCFSHALLEQLCSVALILKIIANKSLEVSTPLLVKIRHYFNTHMCTRIQTHIHLILKEHLVLLLVTRRHGEVKLLPEATLDSNPSGLVPESIH